MNTHKNARLTFARRLEMVQDFTQRGESVTAAAMAPNVSVTTVRKWLGRYLAQGEVALRDRSSRPRLSPRAIAPSMALAIVEVRRHRLTQARIAATLGVSLVNSEAKRELSASLLASYRRSRTASRGIEVRDAVPVDPERSVLPSKFRAGDLAMARPALAALAGKR